MALTFLDGGARFDDGLRPAEALWIVGFRFAISGLRLVAVINYTLSDGLNAIFVWGQGDGQRCHVRFGHAVSWKHDLPTWSARTRASARIIAAARLTTARRARPQIIGAERMWRSCLIDLVGATWWGLYRFRCFSKSAPYPTPAGAFINAPTLITFN